MLQKFFYGNISDANFAIRNLLFHYVSEKISHAINHYSNFIVGDGFGVSVSCDELDLDSIEPSIFEFTQEEEEVIDKAIETGDTSNMSIEYEKLIKKKHDHCLQYIVPCPFWYSNCNFIEVVTKIAGHVTQVWIMNNLGIFLG